MPNRNRIRRLLVTLSFAVVVLGLWSQRQSIFDWWRLRGYNPPTNIARLADDTTMNSATRRVFYVQHPEVDNKSTFNSHCSRDEFTIILGCYIGLRQHIYILDVTDLRLNGVEQVSVAHELLHAEYDRLSANDKKKISLMIKSAYAKVKDKRIIDTINSYRKAGADTTNELHSILGTEIRNLPNDLENYYKRYFTNRLKIVSYSEHYEKAFSDRRNRANAIYSQIKSIEAQLKNMKSQIDDAENSLRSTKPSLDAGRNTAMDVAAYNQTVDKYNRQVEAYRILINTYNNLVGEHNSLVADYKLVTLEENELIKAINSRSSSVSTQ